MDVRIGRNGCADFLEQIPGTVMALVALRWTFRTDTHSLNSYLMGVDDREAL